MPICATLRAEAACERLGGDLLMLAVLVDARLRRGQRVWRAGQRKAFRWGKQSFEIEIEQNEGQLQAVVDA